MDDAQGGEDGCYCSAARLRLARGCLSALMETLYAHTSACSSRIQNRCSKLEAASASPHAGAIYLSTLGGYIAALGAHLEVRAVFPEHPEDDVAVGGEWVGEPDAGRRDG